MSAEAVPSESPYGLAVEVGAAVIAHVVDVALMGNSCEVTDEYLEDVLHTVEAHTDVACVDHTPEALEGIARLARDTIAIINIGQKTSE